MEQETIIIMDCYGIEVASFKVDGKRNIRKTINFFELMDCTLVDLELKENRKLKKLGAVIMKSRLEFDSSIRISKFLLAKSIKEQKEIAEDSVEKRNLIASLNRMVKSLQKQIRNLK